MIRPTTCVCMLMAAGSGLYLYQSKHQAQLLDREINRVMAEVDTTRARAGLLRAEFALLNEPSRLSELASHYLVTLATTQPAQFTNWAELDKRLPLVGAPAPDPAPLEPDAPTATMPVALPITHAPVSQPPVSQVPSGQSPTVSVPIASAFQVQLPTATPAVPPLRTGEPKPAALRNLVMATDRRPVLTQSVVATQPVETSAARVAVQAVPLPPPRVAPTAPVHREQARNTATLRNLPAVAHSAPTTMAPARAPVGPNLAAGNSGPSIPHGPADPYVPPPGTTTEAIARIAHGAPVDPAVPVVASALGMARSIVQTPYAISPANAATYSTTNTR
jgi:hypothetical protein